jgi:hypothetical protein
VNVGLTDNYLKIRGIEATLKLAESNNAKVVIIGSPPSGLPIVLSVDSVTPAATPSPAPMLAAVFLTPPLVFYLLLSLRPKASQPKNAKLQTSSWWTFKQIGE